MKIVALWNPKEPHAGILAIGMFENGEKACAAVTEYSAVARKAHLKLPWAKDMDVVVTGHRTGVKWPEIRLDDPENFGKLHIP